MLTLQFIPNAEIKNLSTSSKIKKILDLIKEEKIVLVEGRLHPNEETALIEKTMEKVSKTFKGIELCTVYSEESTNLLNKLKYGVVSILTGTKQGLTIIGPAAVVKEIKRDPNKVQLLTKNKRKKSKRRRK